jgi:DNA-directed RNA polymerase subunit RPC12/RpoP
MNLTIQPIDQNNQNLLIQLLQLEDRFITDADIACDYCGYYLMLNNRKPIAAMKYDHNAPSRLPEKIIVNPFYPENTIQKAFALLYLGIVQKEPQSEKRGFFWRK